MHHGEGRRCSAELTRAFDLQKSEGSLSIVTFALPAERTPTEGFVNGAVVSVGVTQIVVFRGEYDLASKAELDRDLRAVMLEPCIVLDFSCVRYVDSTTITELVRLANAREEAGLPPPVLVVLDGSVKRVMVMTGVDALFRICGSLEDAITASPKWLHVYNAEPGGLPTRSASEFGPR